ncbi:MAG: hypothetical protein H6718_10255 [Polyangiaceae bacterium]|nr:hypothetical protein [Myxococcales bacterium]MCB9585773.1 hypothetical protein [Polyangiaceae bacterium]MCB9607298.1 hypothetical protein [Polyangiaceae bacterium]
MKRSAVLALVGVLSSGCAFVPWSQTGSEESDPAARGTETPDDPVETDPVDDPTDPFAAPTLGHDGSFSTDTPGEVVDTPEPGSDLPMDGDFVSLAVGELDTVAVDSIYDQKEGSDLCDSHFRVTRSDGMGNSLVIEANEKDGAYEFSVRLDQLKRVNGEWQRLVAYVGPNFQGTEYTVDLRTQDENQGDVVIKITRAIGIGPTQNGWVEGDLFVRLRGTCLKD